MDFQEPFTDQELQMIDAIEASYTKKRLSRADHTREARLRTDRYLPSSLLASSSSSSFSLTPCQGDNLKITLHFFILLAFGVEVFCGIAI